MAEPRFSRDFLHLFHGGLGALANLCHPLLLGDGGLAEAGGHVAQVDQGQLPGLQHFHQGGESFLLNQPDHGVVECAFGKPPGEPSPRPH